MPITKAKKCCLTLVSLALVVVLSMVLYIQFHQSRLLSNTVEYNESTVSWRVFQLEREALRFLNQLNEVLYEPSSKGMQDLQVGFGIFWSRLDVLAQNPASERFLEGQDYTFALERLSRFFDDAKHSFERTSSLDPVVLLSLRQQLKPILPQLQALSNLSIHQASEHAAFRSVEVKDQIHVSTALILFQLLLTLLFFYLIVRLVRQLQKSHHKLDKLANYDSLTGLPNRNLFYDRLKQEIHKAQRFDKRIGLMYIDLDNFKDVNDTLGHDIGDELLQEATKRLKRAVRRSDTVSRLGGDEFTVIIPDLRHYDIMAQISEKILKQLQAPFNGGPVKHVVSASIGITVFPDDARDVNTLLKNADQAMYEAKKTGRSRYQYFTPEMQYAAQCRMQRIHDLRIAHEHKQFSLHYQPIVDLDTGRVHKAEALIRWNHPEQGPISPAKFISLLEETGLVGKVGDWVFQEAAKQVAVWRQTLDPDFQISINTSPVQLQPDGINVNHWGDHLSSMALQDNAIAIEITEGILMDGEASDRLLEMQKAGFEVSLDDFGTGYSSLSYMKKFDINYLKIDKSFVRNLKPNSSDFALCEAIILMAHKLGIKVIAEGIETEGQCAHLTLMGCDYGQGYLFSKPVDAAEFESIVKDRTRTHEKILPHFASM